MMAFAGVSHLELPFTAPDGSPPRPSTRSPATRTGCAAARLTVRLDDAWRTELPAGSRRLVTALTAPLLARYGYPVSH